jgi:acetyltransferase-like isoleucine patch superfamily enzyme
MAEPKLIDSTLRGVICGDGVRIVMPCNLYECQLGEGVFVGPFVEIQRSVVVGARTKIQSHCFLCELVTIGEDCVIAHGVMFINDRFERGRPAGGNRKLWRATNVGDRVSIGSNATILPVKICSDVVIGAGAVVVKEITQPGIYAGNPARLLRRVG